MTTDSFREIVELYKKHGWMLRRVLLSEETLTAVGSDIRSSYSGVDVVASDLDMAWFSRPPADGPIAWELRYLGEPPFALVQNFDDEDVDLESGLAEVEARMAETVGRR